ncbi:MAG: hypothetical protein ACLR8P_23425 [Clostridium fessum]
MIPYINKALSGETVYSQNIVDTTWGPIFTACYPITGDLTGDSDEIVGALCIEMDMQSVNGLVKRTRRASVYVGAMAGCVLFLLCAVCFIGYSKEKEKMKLNRRFCCARLRKSRDRKQSKIILLT